MSLVDEIGRGTRTVEERDEAIRLTCEAACRIALVLERIAAQLEKWDHVGTLAVTETGENS